jgi:hypothetical protein
MGASVFIFHVSGASDQKNLGAISVCNRHTDYSIHVLVLDHIYEINFVRLLYRAISGKNYVKKFMQLFQWFNYFVILCVLVTLLNTSCWIFL